MTTNANRFSTYTTTSVGTGPDSRDGEQKKDMWSSMLDSVASGKRLPEKNLLVLGGSVSSQRDFLESLSANQSRASLENQDHKVPPVANSFALGYTYYHVLDADQEDVLARISLYLLSRPSASFTSLLQPLLTPQTIPNTLIVILLDWSQPWLWMRQLREWLLLLKTVIMSLSPECKEAMEENMNSWRERGRTGGSINLDGTSAGVAAEGNVTIPLGPGEWDEAMGLPLCVVCQNTANIDNLEKTQGWKEEKFDLVLQYLRTVLLRHGASLVYTSPSMSSPLQSLVHASLGIRSLLKREALNANVIDRDKILVLPNWDSWGKIRVLRDGFDVESVSNGWAVDLDQTFPTAKSNSLPTLENDAMDATANEASVVDAYEAEVQDSSLDALQLAQNAQDNSKLEVPSVDTQAFLAQQMDRLEQQKKADDKAGKDNSFAQGVSDDMISDHIGPVQFNMGGIQVDADDMVQRLKDRQAYGQSPEPLGVGDEEDAADAQAPVDTDTLAKFFGNLMNRKPAAGGNAAKP
ncbi:dynein light intermediate chain-domain-containing protein [Microdochium trichocladiopsis]|uniref:Dynein light intermediate chain-domain-containing protein n=1 Tax=Microdochium trichocladiopsis TaxID=1682393 RepID=A0A9P8YDL7_9PEZI|nr:dynein light intermediate chain-domain-containing protein [Microdochium trichocladiopsis]KAH7037520.1 dynein light intermediate chain-domain-containing protein [Microdochium trichocladiopsis]